MMYLLIFVWLTEPYQNASQSSVVAEFNTREACMAAADEVRRQSKVTKHGDSRVPLLMCAAKGIK